MRSGGALPVQLGRGALDPLAELGQRQGQDVAQPVDPRLDQQLVLARAEPGEVEHQRLVAPRRDVVRGRLDVVGQVLPPGRRLRDLQQDAGREDALLLEAGEMERRVRGEAGAATSVQVDESAGPRHGARASSPCGDDLACGRLGDSATVRIAAGATASPGRVARVRVPADELGAVTRSLVRCAQRRCP